MIKRLTLILLLGALAAPAWAGCSLQTLPINLGNYNPLEQAPPPVLVAMTVSCTETAAAQVRADQGGSGSFSERKLSKGINTVNYNLFVGSSNVAIWGDGTLGTSTISVVVGANSSEQVVGNARIYPSQNIVPGLYSDTLVFTVAF